MSASKAIVAELNKDLKLNGENYEVWAMKIQYVLEEQDVLGPIFETMEVPPPGNEPQDVRALEVYQTWKRKSASARIILLSAMDDDLTKQF